MTCDISVVGTVIVLYFTWVARIWIGLNFISSSLTLWTGVAVLWLVKNILNIRAGERISEQIKGEVPKSPSRHKDAFCHFEKLKKFNLSQYVLTMLLQYHVSFFYTMCKGKGSVYTLVFYIFIIICVFISFILTNLFCYLCFHICNLILIDFGFLFLESVFFLDCAIFIFLIFLVRFLKNWNFEIDRYKDCKQNCRQNIYWFFILFYSFCNY